MATEQAFFAPQAWADGRWQYDVRLVVANGRWQSITPGASPHGATRLPGPVLPGVVNAHSHAFQRAIAGLTERSGGRDDDFWRGIANSLPSYRLSKFQPLMPPWVEREVVAAYLLDPAGAAGWLSFGLDGARGECS